MDPWLSLPTELIFRILWAAAEDDPDTLLKFAQTSRRNYAIATDDTAWLPVLSDIFYKHGSPSTPIDTTILLQHRSRILPALTDRKHVFQQFYVRLIGPHRWLLGWWIVGGMSYNYLTLWRVYLRPNLLVPNKDFCIIVGHEATSYFKPYEPPAIVHPNIEYAFGNGHPEGYYAVYPDDYSEGRLPIYGDNIAHFAPPEEVDEIWPRFSINADGGCFDEYGDVAKLPRLHRLPAWSDKDTTPSWELFNGRSLGDRTVYNDAPFPSPSTLAVIPNVTRDSDTSIPIIPKSWFDGDSDAESAMPDGPAIPIHSPSHFASNLDHPDSLVLSEGIYMTPGSTGQRFVYLRMRPLTSADFTETWAWEGTFKPCAPDTPQLTDTHEALDWTDPDVHLGPFSRMRCTAMVERSAPLVSREHVKEGARIIEVVKLAGLGAPGGQRTIVAFVDDPVVDLDEVELARSHLDLKKDGEPRVPWPIKSNAIFDPTVPPVTSQLLQPMFRPERGVDLPAVGRVAHDNFVQPSWIDVVMHVESKDQFTIYWRDINHVEVYTKMYDR